MCYVGECFKDGRRTLFLTAAVDHPLASSSALAVYALPVVGKGQRRLPVIRRTALDALAFRSLE